MDNDFPLIQILSTLPDERQLAKVHHPLVSIVFIAIVSTVAGADEWESMEAFAEHNIDWFKKFVPLPYGVPSHDTIERLFSRMDPKIFLQRFMEWTQLVSEIMQGGIIAIDGKTMCGTYDNATGKKALHIVSAWFSETGLTLGQVKTFDKSNEITAIPELLQILDIAGQIVTIDAMGTQKEIAEKIIDKKGDYVLSLKGNHPLLFDEVAKFFEPYNDEKYRDEHQIISHTEWDKGHGRIERREYYITSDIKWMDARKDWKKLTSIGMTVYYREEKGEKKTEIRYYLCSIDNNVQKFARAARRHWGIESMHWCLDTTFNEDAKRVRKDNGPENLSLLHKFAFNLLKMDTSLKKSLKKKRFIASFNLKYLEEVLRNTKHIISQD